MLRSVGVVLLGFVAMTVIVMVGTALGVILLLPGGFTAYTSDPAAIVLSAPYVVEYLLTGAVAALVGGWLTARLAASAPERHALALVVLVLLMAIVNVAVEPRDASGQPLWYCVTVVAIGVTGVLVGAWLHARTAPLAPSRA